jgi:hypothetical protein
MLLLVSMLRFSTRYSALLLLFMLPKACAVCNSCFGKEPSCNDGGYDKCPWQLAVIGNATALAAAGATLLSVAMTLPPRILRIFTPSALYALMTLHRRPKEGQPFDLENADMRSMVGAVTTDRCSRNEAVVEVASRLQKLDPTAGNYLVLAKGLTAMLDVLKSLTDHNGGVSIKAAGEGALSYILAKLSVVTCGTASHSFDLNVHNYERTLEASSSTSANKFTASLVRPKSMAQAVALLNHFSLVAVSTGVASFLILSPFLDEIFYEPVRAGELMWPTAFECLISYLSLPRLMILLPLHRWYLCHAHSPVRPSVATRSALNPPSMVATLVRMSSGPPALVDAKLGDPGSGSIWRARSMLLVPFALLRFVSVYYVN